MIRSIVVIGPSGNGKSTLAVTLAHKLGWTFVEGDDHHPRENITKMARGEPLNDADREPFLNSVAHAIGADSGVVAACSALKAGYRERLQTVAQRPILFVLPKLSRDDLQRRMADRSGHFMPTSLLDSQLAAFEPPRPGENSLELDGTLPIYDMAACVVRHLITMNKYDQRSRLTEARQSSCYRSHKAPGDLAGEGGE